MSTRIMIVDGDADSRAVYRILLEYRGHEVLEAEEGESALSLAVEARPAVIVTELTLRLVDGHTLIERLRARPETRDACIVVVTARAMAQEKTRAEQAGCTAFLAKPIEPKRLAEEIERLIGA